MHAGLVNGAVVSSNSRQAAQPLKRCTQNARLDGAAVFVRKEIPSLLFPAIHPTHIPFQPRTQIGPDRYTPSSIEPTSANDNEGSFQIDIVSTEAKRLPDQHTRSVQKKKQHPQSGRIDTTSTRFLTRSRFAEQTTDLVLLVDIRNERLCDWRADALHWQHQGHPACSPILEKVFQ